MTDIVYAKTADVTRKYLEEGVNPDTQGGHGNTALLKANLEQTKILLDYGANPNIPDNHGNTPLMWSMNPEQTKLLLEAGADMHIRNNNGYTALMLLSIPLLSLPKKEKILREYK